MGRALDGVAGEGVGVVEAGGLSVDEGAGDLDRADAVEVHREGVLVECRDGALSAVADVGLAVAVEVEVPGGAAGGDSVADAEAAAPGCHQLVLPHLAVGSEEGVGEAVEAVAGHVAAVDHRVVVAS